MKGFKPRAAPKEDRTPAAPRAYNELRRRILHGELPAGALLSEVQAAEDLGVSRTPVREALRELLNDGLLEEGPRRQCVVAQSSPELDREVKLMRVALERLTVREAARVHEPHDLDLLRLTMIRANRALESDNVNEVLDLDDEFHLRIAQIAGLPLIADAVHRLRGLARLVALSRGWSTSELAKSLEEHDAILEAIDAHQPDAAERVLLIHLDEF